MFKTKFVFQKKDKSVRNNAWMLRAQLSEALKKKKIFFFFYLLQLRWKQIFICPQMHFFPHLRGCFCFFKRYYKRHQMKDHQSTYNPKTPDKNLQNPFEGDDWRQTFLYIVMQCSLQREILLFFYFCFCFAARCASCVVQVNYCFCERCVS